MRACGPVGLRHREGRAAFFADFEYLGGLVGAFEFEEAVPQPLDRADTFDRLTFERTACAVEHGSRAVDLVAPRERHDPFRLDVV